MTVDDSQGGTETQAIVSLVRIGETGLGFIKSRERMNVSMTRRRVGLIILGAELMMGKCPGGRNLQALLEPSGKVMMLQDRLHTRKRPPQRRVDGYLRLLRVPAQEERREKIARTGKMRR